MCVCVCLSVPEIESVFNWCFVVYLNLKTSVDKFVLYIPFLRSSVSSRFHLYYDKSKSVNFVCSHAFSHQAELRHHMTISYQDVSFISVTSLSLSLYAFLCLFHLHSNEFTFLYFFPI